MKDNKWSFGKVREQVRIYRDEAIEAMAKAGSAIGSIGAGGSLALYVTLLVVGYFLEDPIKWMFGDIVAAIFVHAVETVKNGLSVVFVATFSLTLLLCLLILAFVIIVALLDVVYVLIFGRHRNDQ